MFDYNTYMRKYIKERTRRRRAEALEGKSCVRCGSTKSLEFDHIDPKTKAPDARSMFSFSEKRLQEELAKCQILCHACHVIKTVENGDMPRGMKHWNNKLTEEQVLQIYALREQGGPTKVGRQFGIAHVTVSKIWKGESWGWLTQGSLT